MSFPLIVFQFFSDNDLCFCRLHDDFIQFYILYTNCLSKDMVYNIPEKPFKNGFEMFFLLDENYLESLRCKGEGL